MTSRWQAVIMRTLTVIVVLNPVYTSAQSQHPMDALSNNEIEQVIELIRNVGHSSDTARFPTITLNEMPKVDVLAWEQGDPVPRSAFVVMYDKSKTLEIEVNITEGKIISVSEVDGQPGVMSEDSLNASRLTKADGRWLAAIEKRGIKSLEAVSCSPLSSGYFPGFKYTNIRTMKVPCYIADPKSSHLYGRPIDGVYSIVDVDKGRVLEIVDLGITTAALAPNPVRFTRDPIKPVVISSPQGVNFKLSGAVQVNWNPWDFHIRIDKRTGPVISLVHYNDNGTKRLMAYQMSLSEMFVPYMSPDEDWSYRTYLDSGEFGAGTMLSSLVPGSDCPEEAAYISATIPHDNGKTYDIPQTLCIFERSTGNPLWRHGRPAQLTHLTRPDIELVVRTIPTIGNYDYVIDWIFTLSGKMEIKIGATGIVAVRGAASQKMTEQSAKADTAYGELVAPGTVAIYHDHYFNFRLDLDVDGSQNTMIEDQIVPQRLPDYNPRRSLWTVTHSQVGQEGPLIKSGHNSRWRIINPNKYTTLGHNPGIEIMPGHQIVSILSPNDPPQKRAEFSSSILWLSKHKPRELYAASDYPNLSPGGKGLPEYIADNDNVENTDLVVWINISMNHVTRAEEWPIMPVRWNAIKLLPFNFFNENPAFNFPDHFVKSKSPALNSALNADRPQ